MWTLFWDMHSGGGTKEEPYEKIYIEAPEQEARVIFYNRFGHNPDRITCTCCGEDYSVSEEKCLRQISGFHRGCNYEVTGKGKKQKGKYVEKPERKNKEYMTLEKYEKSKEVLVIRKEEIKPEERKGDLTEEGWVWAG